MQNIGMLIDEPRAFHIFPHFDRRRNGILPGRRTPPRERRAPRQAIEKADSRADFGRWPMAGRG
jgi:hypothetical protein